MRVLAVGTLLLGLLVSAQAPMAGAAATPFVDAQIAAAMEQGPPVPDDLEPRKPDVEPSRSSRDVVRVGGDFVLTADETVRDVTVVMANATLEGRATRDVSVTFGDVRLGRDASIDGSIIVVGGTLHVEDGARVGRDVMVIGGRLDAPALFSAGHDHIVVGPQSFGGRLDGVIAWTMRGLLWGRLIVPGLPWVWTVLIVLLLLQLLMNVLFDRPVTAVASALAERPLTSLAVGVASAVLLGPVSLLLAVSVIGIAVIPLIVAALVAAWMLGKVAATRWLGHGILQPGEDVGHRAAAMRVFLAGSAVLVLVYMVPVVGLMTWAAVSMFGLGASVMAFAAAYRRENPLPVRAAPVAGTPVMAAVADTGVSQSPATSMPVELPGEPLPGAAGELALQPRASFRDRVAAGALDLILVMIAWQMLDPLFRDNGFVILGLAYLIGFWTWKGTTVGGIICQLRVARVDGQPLRFVDALVRGLSSIFSLMVVGLGFLWILRDPERQAWHDRIAGTCVVKVPRNWPL